jgi:FAD/FMN-containing dehydrogenase
MVAPTSAKDVALIIKILAKKQVAFAIRGGGHTLNAGAANINAGVTINLRSLNNVAVDVKKNIVHVGGGAKWGEVYPKLDALGLSTSGGRVSDVGVGGLSTGGKKARRVSVRVSDHPQAASLSSAREKAWCATTW